MDAPQLTFGAFMHNIESFDAPLFGMSAGEATHADPQQRLLLHHALTCLASAGMLSSAQRDVGVFVGISWTEYARLVGAAGMAVGAYTAQSAVLSVAAGRVSFHLGLRWVLGVGCFLIWVGCAMISVRSAPTCMLYGHRDTYTPTIHTPPSITHTPMIHAHIHMMPLPPQWPLHGYRHGLLLLPCGDGCCPPAPVVGCPRVLHCPGGWCQRHAAP